MVRDQYKKNKKPGFKLRSKNLLPLKTLNNKKEIDSKTEKKSKKVEEVHTKKADSVDGHTIDLKKSGLIPFYVKKPNNGKVPKYLIERKKIPNIQEECFQDNLVNEDEKQAIIFGLKKNWEEIYKRYQVLSVVTDTPSKIKRKIYLENSMKTLEKDIELLTKAKTIYVR
ncbi:MAG: hypothetical protein MHPSP_002200 [Paramarteilia canceri]